MFMANISHLKQ